MHKDDTPSVIPHQPLLDELQVGMLAIVHQLPIVNSMLKWAHSTINKQEVSNPMGWMLVVDPNWTNQDQITHLLTLQKSVKELRPPIQSLIAHIGEFSSFKPIEKALFNIQKSYQNLPIIEPEIRLLSLGHNIFENKKIIPQFLDYTEKVQKLQECGSHLKQVVVQEVLNRLS